MSIEITCPDCRATLRVDDTITASKVRCPQCNAVIPTTSKHRGANHADYDDRDSRPTKGNPWPLVLAIGCGVVLVLGVGFGVLGMLGLFFFRMEAARPPAAVQSRPPVAVQVEEAIDIEDVPEQGGPGAPQVNAARPTTPPVLAGTWPQWRGPDRS